MLSFYILILMGIGCTIAGISAFLTAKYSKEGVREKFKISPSVIAIGTFLSAALFLGIVWIFQYSQGKIPPLKPEFWSSVFVIGVCDSIMNLLIFTAYTKTDLTLIEPLSALPPLFMVFSAWIIMGEIPSIVGFFGIILIVFGVYTLNLKKREKESNNRLRNLFQPFINIWNNIGTRLYFFATIPPIISIVYCKKAVLASDPLTMTMVSSLIIGTLTLIYTLIYVFLKQKRKNPKKTKTSLNLKWIKRLFLLGLLFALTIVLYNTAISMALVSYIGSMKRLSIIVTIFLAYFILKEKKEFKQRLISAIVMVSGVIIIAVAG